MVDHSFPNLDDAGNQALPYTGRLEMLMIALRSAMRTVYAIFRMVH
jgi:hypothetical protein